MTQAADRHLRTVLLRIAAGVTCGLLAACGPSDSGWGDRVDVFACESPDGELTATFYVRQGGGAAGSQQEYVSVRRRGNAAEVLLVEMARGYNVRLAWADPTHLTIGYPQDASMFGWRNRFRQQVADRVLDVEVTPVESEGGLFRTREDECVGGRPHRFRRLIGSTVGGLASHSEGNG